MNKLTQSEPRISLDDLIENIKSNPPTIKQPPKKKTNRKLQMKSRVVIQHHEIVSDALTDKDIDELKALIKQYHHDNKTNSIKQKYQYSPPSLILNFE